MFQTEKMLEKRFYVKESLNPFTQVYVSNGFTKMRTREALKS